MSTDRRVQRTQQSLQNALVALMLEKPYAKITIQEIIDRADVGRATFYNHYDDKDDLLLRGVADITHQREELAALFSDGKMQEHIQQMGTLPTGHMFEHSRRNRTLHQVMFKRSQENLILEKVTLFLRTMIEEQLAALHADERLATVPQPIMAHFLTGGLLALIRWWHDEGFPYSAEQMDGFVQQITTVGER